jgi:hypothetical protein
MTFSGQVRKRTNEAGTTCQPLRVKQQARAPSNTAAQLTYGLVEFEALVHLPGKPVDQETANAIVPIQGLDVRGHLVKTAVLLRVVEALSCTYSDAVSRGEDWLVLRTSCMAVSNNLMVTSMGTISPFLMQFLIISPYRELP